MERQKCLSMLQWSTEKGCFLSFVKFPRHWQLYQLRLKTAKICKIFSQTPELHMAAAQHLKLWEVMLGKQVAGSPW